VYEKGCHGWPSPAFSSATCDPEDGLDDGLADGLDNGPVVGLDDGLVVALVDGVEDWLMDGVVWVGRGSSRANVDTAGSPPMTAVRTS
jgi:hypothetical protein